MKETSQIKPKQWVATVFWLAALFIFVMLTKGISTIHFISEASLLIWPIFALVLVILVLSISIVYSIYIKKDNDVRKLQEGLTLLLVLGGVSLFLGTFGYVAEIFTAAIETNYSGIFGIITMIVDKSDQMFSIGITQILKFNALAMVSIWISILTSLIWFILRNKIKTFEQV